MSELKLRCVFDVPNPEIWCSPEGEHNLTNAFKELQSELEHYKAKSEAYEKAFESVLEWAVDPIETQPHDAVQLIESTVKEVLEKWKDKK